jgi:hypothetical protein
VLVVPSHPHRRRRAQHLGVTIASAPNQDGYASSFSARTRRGGTDGRGRWSSLGWGVLGGGH